VGFLVGNFVADEVRSRVGFLFQNLEVTVEFFAEDFENRGLGKGCREVKNDEERSGQNSHSAFKIA
jgi:hypothetical protein